MDFDYWLSTSVGIPTSAWPGGDITTSPWPGYALDHAKELVPCYAGIPGIVYTLAVYNCATHLVFAIAPDQTGQTYFVGKRSNTPEGFSLLTPSTGLVVAASDVNSSTTYTAPKWADGLTATQLGFFKTPWGREYLGFIQSYGPTIWGLT